MEPDIGSESPFLSTPHAFVAPVKAISFGVQKLEWFGYPTVNKVWLYDYSFWQNSRMWRTGRRTGQCLSVCPSVTFVNYSIGRVCIVSHGKMAFFRPVALFLKRYKIWPLQWKTNRNSYATYRTVPFSITLTTPNPDFKVTPIFDAKYLRNGTKYTMKYW